jgi:hypothetical protein
MKEPVDHILRPALPWRGDEGAITECGYDANKGNYQVGVANPAAYPECA